MPASAGGVWTLLSTTVLAADGPIDVASISGAYNDLILIGIVRAARASTTDILSLQFNNDSAANYGTQKIEANATSNSGSELVSTTSIELRTIPGNTAPAGAFSMFEIRLLGYASTAWLKSCFATLASNSAITTGGMRLNLMSGLWNSTAAINRVKLFGLANPNLLTGSQLRIYGRL
jgi:hypothetical protein